MGLSLKRGAAAWLSASLAGVLMCSVATSALAASPAATDGKLQTMQRQLDDMRAQLDAMKAGGQQPSPQLSAIQQQLDAMAAQLAEMKTGQDTATTDIATLKQAPAGSSVTTTLSNGKPAFATADGRFTANIKAILMLDTGKYFQKNNLPAAVTNRDLNEGANFRRARIGLDGKLFRDFDYSFIYEFGGSGQEDPGRLYEAAITYTALKPLRIKVGAFEPNIGLAAAVSTSQMPLMERPAPAEIARGVAAGDSRVAFQVSGAGVLGADDTGIATRWFASTAFTGNIIATGSSAASATVQPFDEQTAWIGRVALAPYSGTDWQAHIGANYQYVIQPNDSGAAGAPRYGAQLRDRPELRLDGTRLIDTGAIDANHVSVAGLEGAFQYGPAMIEGEWFQYKIDRRLTTAARPADPKFKGWYVQGSWVLTGEPRVYNAAEARFDAPRLTYNFNPEAGTWGAFEVAARYSIVDLNFREGNVGTAPVLGAVRGGEQQIWTVGLNWYLNPSMRMMLDYQHVDIDRLGATGLQVGQTYNALAARGQVNF
ncbi:MAG: porin [Alphaproteobacteria bacterium]|nr:porin [Alphaproteobacteria bacterium]MBU1516478.1 porin [Alphaproteobacteria bacterium]MBU2094235.1 porin [Alphaproteobacteria bacterium]MBU2154188.1 porin [Alphaproteobacteria bacterium]MBU2307405.1 porin [Alphaproteobacteria bacterium]